MRSSGEKDTTSLSADHVTHLLLVLETPKPLQALFQKAYAIQPLRNICAN